MNFWKKLQKGAAWGLILLLLLPLAGCVKDKRFDYSELNFRLRETEPRFTFADTDLFYADGVYYCYYSLGEAEDALLTMKEDAEGKLERVTLTLAAPPTDPRFDDFREFALALAEIFIPGADTEAIRAATNLDFPAVLLQQTLSTYCNGFYSAAAFACEPAVSFILRYSTVYEE